MKFNKIFAVSLLLSGLFSFMPKNPQKNDASDQELLSVGGVPVRLSEFLYVYNKNNSTNEQAYTKENLENYLDLYIKFRLKVREAQALGIDTTKAFKDELAGYKKQLAQPYLTDKAYTDTLVKEAYNRLKEEVRASHILIKCAENADPKDTLAAYQKILDIRKRILAGESFEKLARTYSEDPSAQYNGGDLGFFTALQMIYEFENMAYKTKVGEVSMPFRTKFGYHIVKPTARRPSQGEVLVAHIMVRYAFGTNAEDSIKALRKINYIYQKALGGAEWTALCSEFSEDLNTKDRGGELPMFSTGQSVPSFEEAAFALKNYGDISAPVQTPYGFHIIKLISRRNLGSFEEVKGDIKSKVAKDPRAELSKTSLLNKLKKEHNFKENTKLVSALKSLADSSLVKGTWRYNPKNKEYEKVLFSIGNNSYKMNDFLKYAESKQRIKYYISPEAYLYQLYKEFVTEKLMEAEENNLEKKYPEFKLLLKEYKEGIMLFTLMDSYVWNKAIEDTAGLKAFFNANKNRYVWKNRWVGTIYSCKDASVAAYVKSFTGSRLFPAFPKNLDEVTFNEGKSELDGDMQKKVDYWVTQLKRDKNLQIILTGYATKAEQTKNKNILQARLRSVDGRMMNAGISAARIKTVEKPFVDASKTKGIVYSKVAAEFVSNHPGALERILNEKDPSALQVKDGRFQEGEEEILSEIPWKLGIYTVEKNGRTYVLHALDILPAGEKKLDECRGLVISDYQNELEKQWIESLKAKYPIVVNRQLFETLIKK